MNLTEKLVVATTAINSISRHDDDDADVRRAFLDQIDEHIKAEREAIAARVKARVDELTKKTEG